MICSYNAEYAYQNKIRYSSTRLLAEGGCVWVFSHGTHSQNAFKDKTPVNSKLEEVLNIKNSSCEPNRSFSNGDADGSENAKKSLFKKEADRRHYATTKRNFPHTPFNVGSKHDDGEFAFIDKLSEFE